MTISRRDFLKASSALAAALGLRMMDPDHAEAAESETSVVWLQAQGCSGCSSSLLNSLTLGKAENLLLSQLDLKYHPTLMAAAGPNAVAAARGSQSGGDYILVVEGAIPTAADGRYCYLWPGTTALAGVREFAARAKYVVAVGTCASYGGVVGCTPPGGKNPTGACGLSALVRGKQIIHVPGCHPHPDWIVGVVASLLGGNVPALDDQGRPLAYYARSIHKQCPYKRAAGGRYCLEERGCKGPRTRANCPTIQWNNPVSGSRGFSWCAAARSPCQGCASPDFPGGMMPFHQSIDD